GERAGAEPPVGVDDDGQRLLDRPHADVDPARVADVLAEFDYGATAFPDRRGAAVDRARVDRDQPRAGEVALHRVDERPDLGLRVVQHGDERDPVAAAAARLREELAVAAARLRGVGVLLRAGAGAAGAAVAVR